MVNIESCLCTRVSDMISVEPSMRACPYEGHVLDEVASFVLEMKSQCVISLLTSGESNRDDSGKAKQKGPGRIAHSNEPPCSPFSVCQPSAVPERILFH